MCLAFTFLLSSQMPVEVVVHPRDLNLVFVAYLGEIK